MKISLDNQLLFEINELNAKALAHKINRENLEKHIKDTITWSLKSLCDQAFENMKREWLPILFKRLDSIPTDDKKLLELILSQEDYLDQYARENQLELKSISYS